MNLHFSLGIPSKVMFILLCFYITLFDLSAQKHSCSEIKSNSFSAIKSRTASSQNHLNLISNYNVHYYFLDITLERTSTYISGNVTIKANAINALDTFSFDLHDDLTIDSIFINDQKQNSINRNNGEVDVNLISPISQNNSFDVLIFYHGTPPTGASAAIGNGMSNKSSPSWGNQVTWSLSQPFAASEWWPCKQLLTDKADSSAVHVTTNAENKAGSNGLLIKTDTLPGNKVKFQWKNSHPIDYYLVSVAVAEYVDYTIYANPANSPQPIMIQNYVYNNPATLTNFKTDIDQTADMVELFSELYGLYPFYDEKYGHCMAPLSGGMEHQTMTTQGWFDFTLTAHELGHQWFGDNVTCSGWKDIWVNEGFASYSEYLALEHLDPAGKDNWMTDTHDNVLSEPGGSVYVADSTNVSRIFDSRLTYDKGAAIIHSMRFELDNDSMFFLTLQNYQQQFKYKVGSANNFKSVLENTSGKDFNDFFNQWYYGEGYPIISIKWNQLNDTLVLQLSQTTSEPAATSFFKTSLEIGITTGIGNTTERIFFSNQNEIFKVPVSGTVTAITVDPNNWILNETGTISKDISLNILQNNFKQDISAFPNPTNSEFIITGLNPETNYDIKITDLAGKEILILNEFKANKISVQNFESGIYFLNILSKEGSNVVKLIKE